MRPWVEPARVSVPAVFTPASEDELETPALPREHPRWVKDAIAISLRARRLFTGLKPPAMRVFSFWDQPARSVSFGGRALGVDSSGSYYAIQ